MRATSKALSLFGASRVLLSGPHLKEYHEWNLHEPLLQNYEGWRILDNPPMTRMEAFLWDIGGYGRHLDPIIDDTRLSHSQRVCRLYRWSLKELRCYLTRCNNHKFNLAFKVVRNRFEKYRHVRDPAMCDMMVRETQKYLRETCSYSYYRTNATSPYSTAWWSNGMYHPDNTLVYDHWTPVQTLLYDDAKMHRYKSHNPVYGEIEMWDRWGEGCGDGDEWWMAYTAWIVILIPTIVVLKFLGVFWDPSLDTDENFNEWIAQMDMNMQQMIEFEERAQRSRYATASIIDYNWDYILGHIRPVPGNFSRGGRFMHKGDGFPAVGSPEEAIEKEHSKKGNQTFFPFNL